jgi:hypothetical protein
MGLVELDRQARVRSYRISAYRGGGVFMSQPRLTALQ